MNIVLDDGLSLNISKIENLWSRMNSYGCNIDVIMLCYVIMQTCIQTIHLFIYFLCVWFYFDPF